MTRTLRPQQARVIARAEQAYEEAKRALDDRRRERTEIRDRYRDLLPVGEVIAAGGVRIKRILKSSGTKFRLRAYLDAGKKITAAMRPFVSEPSQYEDWQVKVDEDDS